MSEGESAPDVIAEALERYERAAAFIRRGQEWASFSPDARPIYFSPFRNSLVIREGFAMEKRAAEARDRREWTEGIRRRLRLVAEVHRCRVYRCGPGDWGWFCKRRGCGEVGHFLPSQARAIAGAQEHTRAFGPEPPDGEPPWELDYDGYVPLLDAVPWRVTRGG